MDALLEGLTLTPLKKINHPLGDIYHGLKCSESSFKNFGEAYFSTVKNKSIKGWKKHSRMFLNLVVPVGKIRFVVYDNRDLSPSRGQFFEVTLSQENYQRLTVAPGLWVAFEGQSEGLNLLLNIASIEHDPTEAETAGLEKIKYVW